MVLALAVVDLAGTTVAENGVVERSLRSAVERLGEPIPDDFPSWLHSVRGASKRDMCLALSGGDPTAADRALSHFDSEVAAAVGRGEVTALPRAEESLARLADLGLKVCVTTGFSVDLRGRLLDVLGWSRLVDLALSSEDVGRGRPYPDLVLTALMRLGIASVREVATVGDTVNDLLAGHRSGAAVVAGVLTGAHSRSDLEAVPHTDIVDDVWEFTELVAHC